MTIFKLFYTIKNLKYIQIIYRLKYLIKRKLVEKNGAKLYNRYKNKIDNDYLALNYDKRFILNLRKHYNADIDELLENKIVFLNKKIEFGEKIDWHLEELNKGTRLWKLNLNYHEFLIDIAKKYLIDRDPKYLNFIVKTIKDWFENNPLGTKDYGKDNWNSYAISLRLVSWIKVLYIIKDNLPKSTLHDILELLKIQAYFLYDNLEFDILGNHLIKNWKALTWYAVLFNDKRFKRKANIIFKKYVLPQFSESGMHEELSPMYAGIILEDLLEVFIFERENEKLGRLIQKQFSCLNFLVSDNQYTFFNDSVNFNGVQPKDLEILYDKIFETHKKTLLNTGHFRFDGFIGFKNAKEQLIFDAGPIVLGNQPGHVQCDALSFEYFRDNQKIFTNSGTFEYNGGSRRAYSRSTEAHNTLKYGGFDQSEIWGSFRVARRAKVDYEILDLSERSVKVNGRLRGFDFSKNIIHRRNLEKTENKIKIQDKIVTNNKLADNSYVYFHLTPDFNYQKINENTAWVLNNNSKIAIIKTTFPFSIIYSEYYSEFGKVEKKNSLKIGAIPPNETCLTEIKFENE